MSGGRFKVVNCWGNFQKGRNCYGYGGHQTILLNGSQHVSVLDVEDLVLQNVTAEEIQTVDKDLLDTRISVRQGFIAVQYKSIGELVDASETIVLNVNGDICEVQIGNKNVWINQKVCEFTTRGKFGVAYDERDGFHELFTLNRPVGYITFAYCYRKGTDLVLCYQVCVDLAYSEVEVKDAVKYLNISLVYDLRSALFKGYFLWSQAGIERILDEKHIIKTMAKEVLRG